jgi:hypothetical protein
LIVYWLRQVLQELGMECMTFQENAVRELQICLVYSHRFYQLAQPRQIQLSV